MKVAINLQDGSLTFARIQCIAKPAIYFAQALRDQCKISFYDDVDLLLTGIYGVYKQIESVLTPLYTEKTMDKLKFVVDALLQKDGAFFRELIKGEGSKEDRKELGRVITDYMYKEKANIKLFL